MIFQTIDGVKLADVDQSILIDFLVEHVFFRFMDNGRYGIQTSGNDVVSTLITHFEQKGLVTKEFTTKQFDKFHEKFVKDCVTSFINKGSTGIYHSVIDITAAIVDEINK